MHGSGSRATRQLEKRGKGILLMHDFHKNTAEALPELLHQLKGSGYKVVHMVPRQPLTTIPKYDEMVTQRGKLSSNNTRPQTNVARAIGAGHELLEFRRLNGIGRARGQGKQQIAKVFAATLLPRR
jgi:hypothetical protein